MEKTPPGLAASDIDGGELLIEGVVKVIIMGGDKQRKHISFIAVKLLEGKEQSMFAMGDYHSSILSMIT